MRRPHAVTGPVANSGPSTRRSPGAPIRAWQIWNEQNSPTFFDATPNAAPLRDAARDRPRRDHGVDSWRASRSRRHVRNPARGAGARSRAARFLATLYRHRASAPPTSTGRAASLRAYPVRRHRPDRPLPDRRPRRAGDAATGLWITELGWASDGEPSALNVGLRGQASACTESFTVLVAERRQLRHREPGLVFLARRPGDGRGPLLLVSGVGPARLQTWPISRRWRRLHAFAGGR